MAQERRPKPHRCSDCGRTHQLDRMCLPNPTAPCATCNDLGVLYNEGGAARACGDCPD